MGTVSGSAPRGAIPTIGFNSALRYKHHSMNDWVPMETSLFANRCCDGRRFVLVRRLGGGGRRLVPA
jgi:hypothetical protein